MTQTSMGIAGWLSSWADVQPDAPLIITMDGTAITWGEFDDRVGRLAAGLRELGVGHGDRVACLMHNRPEFLELFWATVRLGAVFVPLNVRLAVPELEYVLTDVEPAVVATDETFTATVAGLAEASVHWLTAQGPLPVACSTWADAHLPAALRPQRLPNADDAAAILYTSGTTGRPKGAVVNHSNIHAQCVNWNSVFACTRHDRQILFLPLCFTGGLISASMNTMLAGGSMIVVEGFEPEAVLGAIAEHRATWFTGVPTMVQRLFEHPTAAETDLSSLRMVESGGSPVPVPLIERARELGLELMQGYGITEGTGGVNLYLQEWEGIRKAGSCGKPGVLGRAKVVDDTGAECAPGVVGELLLGGPLVFQGYWRNEAATAETLVDGWLHTGDLARRDEEGFYFLVGRKKEMIITGGLNVYPVEIESVIQRLPEVRDVAVVGQPDARWGEAVSAYLVAEGGMEVHVDEVGAHCRRQLADYKVPKAIHVLTELPRTASGKVRKHALLGRDEVPVGQT